MSAVDPPEDLFERVDALGAVVETDRGSLPFALVHGEPAVACAAWALGEAGVTVLDLGTPWLALVEDGRPLVLHDALCPMTPPAFLAACVTAAEDSGAVIVGVRPVTDTAKRLDGPTADRTVGDTVDRGGLLQVASPVVLPPSVVAALEELPATGFAELVTALAARFPVRTLVAPATARRLADAGDVPVLEALTVAQTGAL